MATCLPIVLALASCDMFVRNRCSVSSAEGRIRDDVAWLEAALSSYYLIFDADGLLRLLTAVRDAPLSANVALMRPLRGKGKGEPWSQLNAPRTGSFIDTGACDFSEVDALCDQWGRPYVLRISISPIEEKDRQGNALTHRLTLTIASCGRNGVLDGGPGDDYFRTLRFDIGPWESTGGAAATEQPGPR